MFSARRAWNPQAIFLGVPQHSERINPFSRRYLYQFDSVRYLLWALIRSAVKTLEKEDSQSNYDNEDEDLHAAIL